MEQDTKNQLERHGSLAAFFEQTRARWENIPALKLAIEAYLTRQQQLPKPPPDVDFGNKATTGALSGATQDKATARTALVSQLVPLAAAEHLWLAKPANAPADETAAARQRELAARLDIRRPSMLGTMAGLLVVGLADAALQALDLVPAAHLAAYEITDNDVKDFEKTAETFGLRRGAPRAVVVLSAIAAETLDLTLDELDAYVTGDLRKNVDTRRFKDPEFVRGFKRAYTLVDRRGGRGGNKPNGGDQPG